MLIADAIEPQTRAAECSCTRAATIEPHLELISHDHHNHQRLLPRPPRPDLTSTIEILQTVVQQTMSFRTHLKLST
jgi:hypothetical protein